MTKPRVFVSRRIPEAGLEWIQAWTEAEIWPNEEPPPYDVLIKKASGVAGLVCLLTDRIDRTLLSAAGESLKVISQMAVGVDNIDLHVATALGIPVGHTPGVLTETTADFAFTLLMTAARRVVEAERYVKAGRWKTWGPTLLMGQDIHRSTLGIVGFGRIGQGVALRAMGFEMRVLCHDPHVDPAVSREFGAEPVSLTELLKASDFVSLHVPLTEDTVHLLGAQELEQMKPSAILVNTSRGGVVDPEALYRALRDGGIAYAALDVTEPEPISPDDPLLTLDNCIVVPHIASSSYATRARMASMAAENLKAGLAGQRLPHCVNPEVYG